MEKENLFIEIFFFKKCCQMFIALILLECTKFKVYFKYFL